MKIFVTGAKGQVGAELIRRGEKLGLQMIAASHAELDISSKDKVEEFVTRLCPDLVINGAAYTAVDKAESEVALAHAINGHGPGYLARACAARNIPFFHISTDYVFDGKVSDAYSEDDQPNPQGVYGASKLLGEQSVAQATGQFLILRVAWVFGALGQNFVRTMLRLGGEHDEVRIVADQNGGPTWAGDIATTLLSLAMRYDRGEDLPWGIYHYNGEPCVSWCEFAETIFAEAHKLGMIKTVPKVVPITTAEYPTPAKRPLNSRLNCQKIKKQLAITVPDWRNGLIKTLTDWNV